jgi:regulator of Ty1 transposition protein 103
MSTNSFIELDKSRSSGKKPLLGGSLFSSSSGSVPPELQPLVPLQVAVSKAAVASTAQVTAANAEYDRMNDPNTPLPTPPVHAARLSQLLKSLANAESSVSEIIKSRQALIDGLEKLLDNNRSALAKDQSLVSQLSERKAETETKKRDVEDAIMRGLSAENSPAVHNNGEAGAEEVPRPEIEGLTPPPVESLTPVGSPKPSFPTFIDGSQDSSLASTLQSQQSAGGLPNPTLPGFSLPYSRPDDDSSANGFSAKRRKVTHGEEDYAQFAGGDLDADVAELLKQESEP